MPETDAVARSIVRRDRLLAKMGTQYALPLEILILEMSV